jgi:ribosomal protein S18 acetylase RimI-like enzyme
MARTALPRSWDSTFFGVPIFEARLGDGGLDDAIAEAVRGGAECLYLFVDAGELATIDAAVRHGAHLVDLRVELEGPRFPPEPGGDRPRTRRATQADHDFLVTQARELASESRFARDPRIPAERVRDMYELWLDRCLDEGVVAVPHSPAVGFVGARTEDDVALIELVFVDAASRGQGVGGALIREAVASLAATDIRVVTQAGNVAAQRLYQSFGLRSRSTLAVLHLWLDERLA